MAGALKYPKMHLVIRDLKAITSHLYYIKTEFISESMSQCLIDVNRKPRLDEICKRNSQKKNV